MTDGDGERFSSRTSMTFIPYPRSDIMMLQSYLIELNYIAFHDIIEEGINVYFNDHLFHFFLIHRVFLLYFLF